MKKIAPDSVPDEARRMKLELPKPEGYVYYASDLTVSGTSIRRKECKKFLLLKRKYSCHRSCFIDCDIIHLAFQKNKALEIWLA